MRAALRFLRELDAQHLLDQVESITIDLYGSLALTGHGHGTDRAILLGLLGQSPDTVALDQIDGMLERVRGEHRLKLMGRRDIPFVESDQMRFHRDQMYPDPAHATHPNGMRFTVFDAAGNAIASDVLYSIGGGFILSATELEQSSLGGAAKREVPYPFSSGAELLRLGEEHQLSIPEIILRNEVSLLGDATITRRIDRIVSPARPGNEAPPDMAALTPEQQIEAAILTLWHTMEQCIERGLNTEGTLPGGLNVRRRAPGLAARAARLDAEAAASAAADRNPRPRDPLAPLDTVTMVAMAVNEENAAGGRVVTAPTNGAAGVIPAIAYYYLHHASEGLSDAERQQGLLRYFLAAAAIGILYKENASISGAEVGCQGEVGVACSMAAGGLVAALNGDNAAIEHAAEIAMEHNLGMTCDPIGGLVQIPCIERNGMGAVKAVNAARLAVNDPGTHKISLDQVIETMYRTGMDMQSRYKETSLAGLALNIIEC
jgi:L-serine dehydratase